MGGQGQKRVFVASAVLMNFPRHEFLPGPAFSRDEHAAFTRRRMPHDPKDIVHLGAVADDAPKRVAGLDLGSERNVLPFEPLFFQRPADRDSHLIRREGLGDIVIDTFLDGIDRRRDGAERGNDDEDAVRRYILNAVVELEPVHLRHLEVRYDEVVRVLSDVFDSGHAAYLSNDLDPLGFKDRLYGLADACLVVDNERSEFIHRQAASQ